MSTAHAHAEDFVPRGGGVARSGEAFRSKRPRPRSVKVVRAFEEIEGSAVESRAGAAHRAETRSVEGVPRRWAAFLALAEARGVSADEVAARFSGDDIADLCAPEHGDAMLARCMDTLAESVRRERATSLAIPSPWEGEGGAEPHATAAACQVRCADCRHFRRRTSHPHLGECDGGVPRTAAGGFWDDQRRGCGTFVPSSR